jgi:hypothetical protein
MGFIDDVAPPAGAGATYNQIQGPKEAAPATRRRGAEMAPG